jgi:hypothetical protein
MKLKLLIFALLATFARAQVIPAITAECATSVDGTVVGTPNPLNNPQVAGPFSGSLPSGTYYIEIGWYDAASHNTLVSPEVQYQLVATGELQISPPSSGMPATAAGMNVYIATSSGAETLQGTTVGSATFTQSTALVTGANPPSTNNTICQIIANDAGWPTGTGYAVGLTTPSGITQPGYPMQWQILGPGNTINVGQGLPYYNGTVQYPVPILARPYGHATQSISGGLNIGSYPFTSGYATLNSGGTFTGTFTGNPTFTSINFSTGFQLQGSYGAAGDLPESTGTGTIWSAGAGPGGNPSVVVGSAAGTGGSATLQSGSKDKMGLVIVNTGTSPPNSGIVASVTFGIPFATYGTCTISQESTDGLTLPTQILITGVGTTGFSIYNQGAPALTASATSYIWSYICNGY